MDEMIYITLLRNIGIVASILGALVGLDLILGARITFALKRFLEKSYDLETAIKRALEQKTFDFDKLVASPRVKVILGIIFIGFSLLIFLLLRQI